MEHDWLFVTCFLGRGLVLYSEISYNCKEVVRVLIAKTKEGQYFTLIGQVNRYVLRQIRTNHQFYCPQCEEEVLLKVGEFKTLIFHTRKKIHVVHCLRKENLHFI